MSVLLRSHNYVGPVMNTRPDFSVEGESTRCWIASDFGIRDHARSRPVVGAQHVEYSTFSACLSHATGQAHWLNVLPHFRGKSGGTPPPLLRLGQTYLRVWLGIKDVALR